MNKFFERFQDPQYWIKMRARFTWHNRRALKSEHGSSTCRHHSRCMCLIGAWLQQDKEDFNKMNKVFHA